MSEMLLVFLAGMAGSAHCLGMCGGFACSLGADGRGPVATARRHLAYNLARVGTYCFIGALVGHLGALVVGHAGEGTPAGVAQRVLALASGLLMLLVGLQFLGWLGRLRMPQLDAGVNWLVVALRSLRGAPGIGAPLALGVFNGLLPCPLVYAFAAQAAASGGASTGALTMAVFGLGTFPMMLAAGVLGSRSVWRKLAGEPGTAVVALPVARSPAARLHRGPDATGLGLGPAALGRSVSAPLPGLDRRLLGVRVAGAFIVALGLVTLARGLLPLGAHLHGA